MYLTHGASITLTSVTSAATLGQDKKSISAQQPSIQVLMDGAQ